MKTGLGTCTHMQLKPLKLKTGTGIQAMKKVNFQPETNNCTPPLGTPFSPRSPRTLSILNWVLVFFIHLNVWYIGLYVCPHPP